MSRAFASTDRITWASRATPSAFSFSCFVNVATSGWTNGFPRGVEWVETTCNFADSTKRMRFERNGTGESADNAFTPDGTWHHIVWTHTNGTDTGLVFWVDGVQVASASGTWNVNTNTGTVTLGNRSSDFARPLDGSMAYPSCYDKVLSQSEVEAIRDNTTGTTGYLNDASLIFEGGVDCDFDSVTSTAGTITGTTLNAGDGPFAAGGQTINAATIASGHALHNGTVSVAGASPQTITAVAIASGHSLHAAASIQETVAAPTNLVATAVSASQIDLSWTDVSTTETAYVVERSADGSTGWVVLTSTLAANSTSYSDTGLDAEATWFYRVRARRVLA